MKKKENQKVEKSVVIDSEKDYLALTIDLLFSRETIDYRGDEFIDPRFVVNF